MKRKWLNEDGIELVVARWDKCAVKIYAKIYVHNNRSRTPVPILFDPL